MMSENKKRRISTTSSESDGQEEEEVSTSNSSTQTASLGWAKFIRSLFEMASSEGNAGAVGFSDDGLCLEIRDSGKLSSDVLPKYFKHKNVSSVIRQLSNYGFKKISSSGANPLQSFMHENFRHGRADLLGLISRRGSGDKKDVKALRRQIEGLRRKEVELEHVIVGLHKQNSQLLEQNRCLMDEQKKRLHGASSSQVIYLTSPLGQQQHTKQQRSLASMRPTNLNIFQNYDHHQTTSMYNDLSQQLTPHHLVTPSNRPALTHLGLHPSGTTLIPQDVSCGLYAHRHPYNCNCNLCISISTEKRI